MSRSLFGRQTGPDLRPFVLVAATVWSLADLLTAFLLLAQFYVSGTVLFGFLAGAYASSGILTWAYLAAFPGIFRTGPSTLGDQQVSIYMWAIRHCTFPALVIGSTFASMVLGRFTSRAKIHAMTALIFIALLVGVAAICAYVFSMRDALPLLALDAHFTPLWKSVAVFASTLDAFLNTGTVRYTFAWDTAKVITVFTSAVVLVMILCDIVGLYGQIARVSRIDVLTSLDNRRAFEEHSEFVFANARRVQSSMAMLLIDLDHFTRYNETSGRVAADACLQQIAQELAECATRPLDLVARYGGRQFVVIAERIRAAIEALDIVHDGKPLGHATVSIGVGYAPEAGGADGTALIAAADSKPAR